jgi:ADP-ribose pyrophosphatase YjhB (NUDIX family)
MGRLFDAILRTLLTAGSRLFRRRLREGPGVHAVGLTPEGRIVLVKLRYAPGWRLPGGGMREGEDARTAALRELEEEIGMTGHGSVEEANVAGDPLIVVRGVRYLPRRWSLEVEDIMEATADTLPADLAPIAAHWLAALRGRI